MSSNMNGLGDKTKTVMCCLGTMKMAFNRKDKELLPSTWREVDRCELLQRV